MKPRISPNKKLLWDDRRSIRNRLFLQTRLYRRKQMRERLRLKQLIWPDMKTESVAKIARLPALIFSVFSTCLWAAMAVATVFGHKSTYGNLVFLHLTFFAVVSVGFFKMRREASIAYLVVCVMAVIFSWGHAVKLIASIAGILVSILAVRGTFSYAIIVKNRI